MDIGTSVALERLKKSNQWLLLKEKLSFKEIGELLKKRLRAEDIGREPYNPLSMFRALLIGQLQGMSDYQLEESLSVRTDYIIFCGFNLTDHVPDQSTIVRFRQRLVKAGILDECLRLVNKQLEELGLKPEKVGEYIIDSTIIKSAARPKNEIEVDDSDDSPKISSSKDKDARWTKKNGKPQYGYQQHTIVEAEYGFIEALEVTPANVHETTTVEMMVEKVRNPKSLAADKGYCSKKNRDYLQDKNIEDRIMRKAQKNTPLTEYEIQRNKRISKRRWIIEQTFGLEKHNLKFQRASYLGTVKVQAQATLKAICLNIKKAVGILIKGVFKLNLAT